MADVKCPRDKKTLPMKNCTVCEFLRNEEDPSTVWCRFLIGIKQEKVKSDYRRLYAQVNYKRRRADRYYKVGKPRIAEQIEYEIMKIRKEIIQHEIEAKTFNQKKETAL